MCLFFPRRTKESSKRKPSLPRRMSTFGRGSAKHAKHSLYALRGMMDITTLVSPTQGGFHKPLRVGTMDAASFGSARKELILSPAVEKHLQFLYFELCGLNKELSREKFVSFLKNTQKEAALVPMERDTYSFQQFLEVWYLGYGWDALRPIRPAQKDLSRPISNYFISSSHNTYLEGNQLSSRSTADAYRKVLKQDCRCIEIDVWNGDALANRWNGDAPAAAPPPAAKTRSRSPHTDHRRHLSTNSVADTLEETYSTIKGIIAGSHSRNPSTSTPAFSQAVDPRDSGTTLATKDDQLVLSQSAQTSQVNSDTVERSRSSSKSSGKMEPIVMHGWTLTSPVGFRDVCRAIRESAFVRNPLPIIVSLEVHADYEQQEVMVEIMKEEWAGLLLDNPMADCDPATRQPRLDELLNKILIKVKRQPKVSIPVTSGLPSTPSLLTTPASTMDDSDLVDDEKSIAPSASAPCADAPEAKKGKVPICAALSALAVYTFSDHFKSFDAPASRKLGHIFSINENKILELHEGPRQKDLFMHNRNYFMRAFPKGMRVDSSNPDPSLYWRRGVQMVAMNWQNWDEGMMLEHAMFADEQGWVLKPPGYRSSDASYGEQRTLDLKITVFAGQHIPLPVALEKGDAGVGTNGDKSFHPLIKFELHVDTTDESLYKKKTRSATTDHPNFGTDGATVEFHDVRNVVEELSFLRFKVEDEHGGYLYKALTAWACIRLDRLQPGYRIVELMSAQGKRSDGRLLVKVEKSWR